MGTNHVLHLYAPLCFLFDEKMSERERRDQYFSEKEGETQSYIMILIFFKASIQLLISLPRKNGYPVLSIAKANRRKSFKCVMKSNKPTQAWLWDIWNDYICVCLSLDLQIRRRIWINDDKKRRFVFPQ